MLLSCAPSSRFSVALHSRLHVSGSPALAGLGRHLTLNGQ